MTDAQLIKLAHAINMMPKEARIGGLLPRLRPASSAGIFSLPVNILFGKPAKRGIWKGIRAYPRRWSPYRRISEAGYVARKMARRPVARIDGKPYAKGRAFGGVAGIVQRRPAAALLAALLLPEIAKTGGGSPARVATNIIKRQVAPFAPRLGGGGYHVPAGYHL